VVPMSQRTTLVRASNWSDQKFGVFFLAFRLAGFKCSIISAFGFWVFFCRSSIFIFYFSFCVFYKSKYMIACVVRFDLILFFRFDFVWLLGKCLMRNWSAYPVIQGPYPVPEPVIDFQ
jgi:hypothetical protein